jgi:transcription elongation factor GreA
VVFGSTVLLHDHDSDAEITYQIVGEDEADIREGRVSFTSPVARALIGRRQGEDVTVRTPAGERDYEILEVRYE